MANGHGGERTPANPAPVSGPGALSARTDGGPTSQPPMVASGGPYGSRQEMEAIQSGADMQGGGGGMTGPTPLPLTAPTASPDEPITSGVPVGAGLSPQAAGIADDRQATDEQLRPMLHSLEMIANLPGSNPETRAYVRLLKARLSNG